ncbi:MAG: hypothetical protein ABJP48_03450 [Erythrobacter sp.]
MRISSSRAAKAAGIALIAGLVGGCAFTPQLSQVAVDHNRMVARSTNELALLNIVRASHRFPLHFTAISEITGNARVSLNAELALGLEPGPDPQSANVGGRVSTNPSFRATVLATEKFQRGIQSPISPGLVAYYLDDGWRDELIMALMVERVDVFDETGTALPAEAIINNGTGAGRFAQLLCTHHLISEPTSSSVPLANFNELIDLDAASNASEPAAKRRSEIGALVDLIAKDGLSLTGDTLVIDGSTNTVKVKPRSTSRCADVAIDSNLAGKRLQPRFRSTLGLVYFLGEYLRLRDRGGSNSA